MRNLLYRLSARLPCRLIKLGDQPYLERYYLGQALGVTAYLHRFVGSDGDRDIHDHPWRWAAALVLTGGYREERLRWLDPAKGWHSVMRRMFPGRVNRLGPMAFHRITDTKPETWTLFVHGRRVKPWGYLQPPHGSSSERVLYVPYPAPSGHAWWLTAPTGAESGRVEMAA